MADETNETGPAEAPAGRQQFNASFAIDGLKASLTVPGLDDAVGRIGGWVRAGIDALKKLQSDDPAKAAEVIQQGRQPAGRARRRGRANRRDGVQAAEVKERKT